MPRNVFDRELERLGADLADMGRRVDVVMLDTIHCLKTMDTAAAGRVFGHDGEINAREKSIEQSCMNLIALQQPLARDLRAITATLKIITDMERIADQCADICEILSTVSGLAAFNPPPKLLEMFDKARRMFAGALDAYIRRDGKLAEAVCRSDDEVDALFSASILELCGKICSSPNTSSGSRITPPMSRNGRFLWRRAHIPISTTPRRDIETGQDGAVRLY